MHSLIIPSKGPDVLGSTSVHHELFPNLSCPGMFAKYYAAKKSSSMAGLQKLFHPAIPDGRTWSKYGEHG